MAVMNGSWLFHLHLFFTLYMVGLIWFVQVVHYPLMGRVGAKEFVTYENAHTRLTGWVTAPPMIVELVTAALLWWQSGQWTGFWALNLGTVLLLWGTTFFVQVPLHNRLSGAFRPEWHLRLVRSNWIRTGLWTVRGFLLIGSL